MTFAHQNERQGAKRSTVEPDGSVHTLVDASFLRESKKEEHIGQRECEGQKEIAHRHKAQLNDQTCAARNGNEPKFERPKREKGLVHGDHGQENAYGENDRDDCYVKTIRTFDHVIEKDLSFSIQSMSIFAVRSLWPQNGRQEVQFRRVVAEDGGANVND